MMKLRRGSNIVLGLTAENLASLTGGQVIRVRGEEFGAPGLTFYLISGNSHEEMRDILRANGYDIPESGDDGHS